MKMRAGVATKLGRRLPHLKFRDMEEQLEKYREILKAFKLLPKIDSTRTLLEICHYPYNRREEVASRILKFFIDPNAEHGLGHLWVNSLLTLVEIKVPSSHQKIVVETEVRTHTGKRIDIVIEGNDFVIAIENKLTASVYNDLDDYKNYIESKYGSKKFRIKLILSMRPITDDLKKIEDSGFKRLNYQELFKEVNSGIGDYMMSANPKYITFMYDFIKTINNMSNASNNKVKEFFKKNHDDVENLIKNYNAIKAELWEEMRANIAMLCDEIKRKTGDETWWIYADYDLGKEFNNNTIGIESWYVAEGLDYSARYDIYITTWKLECWPPYREEVLKQFADNYSTREEQRDKRVYVLLTSIQGNDTETILEKLQDVYNRLSGIVDKVSDVAN